MADSKITALTALTAADPANDMIPIVDVSDTPPASGNTKRISINNILACSPSATLASATITGDLGVGTASPSTKLEVATATSNTRLRINSTSVVATEYFRSGTGLWLVGSDSTNAFKIARGSNFGGSADYFSIGSATAECTWFDAAGGTRMTLNATGLGIGGSPTSKLTIGTGSFSAAASGTTGMYTTASGLEMLSDSYFFGSRAGGGLMTLDASGNLLVGTTSGSFRGQFAVVSGADRNIFTAQVTGASNGLQVLWNHATTTLRIVVANLPTSSAGLATGTLWIDTSAGNTLKVA